MLGSRAGASVEGLLGRRCPSAIAGFVVAVIIDPVNLVAVWRLAHIGKEVGEGIPPSIADADPARSVVVVSIAIRVGASLHHAAPHIVNRMLAHAVSGAGFALEAATGLLLAAL